MPFLNFFDGFRTSHEIQKIEAWDYDDLAKLVDQDALKKFRDRGSSPDHPTLKGSLENSDIYFQQQEVQNRYYQALPDIVEEYMEKVSELTGREYHPFTYYGAPDADRMIIAMGSLCDATKETVDYLNAHGEKTGLLSVHLYRPFSLKYFFKYIPETVRKIAVLDRTKEQGSLAEPLYLDVTQAYSGVENAPLIVGGRAGLGGKDTTPTHILSVFENLKQDTPKDHFTVAITDDVTNTSLPVTKDIDTTPAGTTACKFWGLGSDGTVGANKSAVKIIGNHTNMYAQAYFAYDSKKSGGITVSHLRFGKTPITSSYLINKANFVSCSQQTYVHKYDVLAGIKDGGTFLLNTIWDAAELEQNLPASMKRTLAQKHIQFYTINAVKIAQDIGLGGRFNMIMQSAFFKLADIIPVEDAVKYLKDAVVTNYGKKGQKVVDMNNAAIDQGVSQIVKIDIPAAWADATDAPEAQKDVPEFITKLQKPINAQEGDSLPVSAFLGLEDGAFPQGTAAYEKRGVAINVPEWQVENCLQCNQCAMVCPHAAIRPVLTTDEELAAAPEGFQAKPAVGMKNMNFTMQVSVMDCLGCGSCAQVCPAKEKALVMKPFSTQEQKAPLWDYAMSVSRKANPMNKFTVKGSQFEQPLLEFSGACAGCGETPYAKLVTQLFGDRMMVANAHGCSSVWGGSAPDCGYTKNAQGHGPAWSTSLFEDNAEYGFGMMLAEQAERKLLEKYIDDAMDVASPQLQEAFKDWKEHKLEGEGSRQRSDTIIALLEQEKEGKPALEQVYEMKKFLVKRSQWIFGGDGWAYDIGYGGLDHVLAQGQDINVLVFDTEVYSNTGGQASKATPTAAVAQFAASGKKTKKKDLGMMEAQYGYIYVAQVAMGADKNQFLKALKEAEAYNGPSLIIGYAPCINHGLKVGQGQSQLEEKRAVEAGYWHLWRYNPELKKQGKNPFILDSKPPTANFRDFLMGETRFASLKRTFPDTAEALFEKTEQDAKERYEGYVRLTKAYDEK